MWVFILICILIGVIIYFSNPEYWDDISNPDNKIDDYED